MPFRSPVNRGTVMFAQNTLSSRYFKLMLGYKEIYVDSFSIFTRSSRFKTQSGRSSDGDGGERRGRRGGDEWGRRAARGEIGRAEESENRAEREEQKAKRLLISRSIAFRIS